MFGPLILAILFDKRLALVFSLLLIAIFGFIVVRGLYKAMKLSDPFEQVAAAGLPST